MAGEAERVAAGEHFFEVLLEAGVGDVEVEAEQLIELGYEQAVVPAALLAGAVVHEPQALDLGDGEASDDVHRHLLTAELEGGPQAGVAGDDDAGLVDDDRLAPTVVLNRERHLLHDGVADDARVGRVGNRSGGRPPLNMEAFRVGGGVRHRRSSWAPAAAAGAAISRGSLAAVLVGAVVAPDDDVPVAAEAAHVDLDASPGGEAAVLDAEFAVDVDAAPRASGQQR